MTRHSINLVVALLTLLAASVVDPAQAAQRTFVSSSGVDTGVCSLTAPCRSFGAAIARTAAGGEVIVLDSGGYGAVTISQSVSLIAPTGVYAGVSVFTGDGVTIDAFGATVLLRGLVVNGQGGNHGVHVFQAARVRIEGCVIANMAHDGFLSVATGAEIVVVDSVIRDNVDNGIEIGGDGTVVVERTHVAHNRMNGLYTIPTTAHAILTVRDSEFVFNGTNGISVDSHAGRQARVAVDRTLIANNGAAGFRMHTNGGTAIASLTRNTVQSNGTEGVDVMTDITPVVANLAENAIASNGTAGVSSAGFGASVWLSANTFSSFGLDLTQVGGGGIATYQNNAGTFSHSAPVSLVNLN